MGLMKLVSERVAFEEMGKRSLLMFSICLDLPSAFVNVVYVAFLLLLCSWYV